MIHSALCGHLDLQLACRVIHIKDRKNTSLSSPQSEEQNLTLTLTQNILKTHHAVSK